MRPLVFAILLIVAPAQADAGDPFTTRSDVPIGINVERKTLVVIDQTLIGTITTFTPVAYSHPKWKKTRGLKMRSYKIDTKDAETEARTKERSQKTRNSNDQTFEKSAFLEARPIPGGFSGRYRVPDMGLVVYLEDDAVLARTGDLGVMKTMPVVKSVARLIKRCKGTKVARILHVVATPDWNSVAVYLQSTCTPEDEEAAATRVRKLYVVDVSGIL